MQHLRLVVRSLLKAPGFTAAAVATLALGVAFTTAMFAVVDGVLLRPLPFRDPERVVLLQDVNTRTQALDELSWQNFTDLRESAKSLDSAALWIMESHALADGDIPERVYALRVTPSLFRVFGIGALHGRSFREDETTQGRDDVIVLSHAFWQSRFAGDPKIVGHTVRVDGEPKTVIGVLPPEATFPRGDVAFWEPLVLRQYERDYRDKRMFRSIARLAPGVGIKSAAAEIRAISARLEKQYLDNRDWLTLVVPAREGVVPDQRPLLLLLAAALLVLILACANVANLLLARATATRADAAVRAALGARRFDLALHALREAAVLAAGGTILGIGLAAWIVNMVDKFRPATVPTWSRIVIDARVLAVSVGVLVAAALLAGLLPAVAASREAMQSFAARGGVGARRGGMLRRVLTATQVALAVVLLVCALLLVRTVLALQAVDPGFRSENRVAATLFLPEFGAYRDDAREIGLFRRYLERLRATPGVVSAAGVTSLPLNPVGVHYGAEIFVDGFQSERAPEADYRLATPGFFATMGIPFVVGRDFRESDDARAARVAIVNEAFVKKFAGGRDPIGMNVRLFCPDDCPRYTIVGVVGDTRHDALDRPAAPQFFVPYTQEPHGELTIVAQVKGDPNLVKEVMRRELVLLDPNLALANIATVDEIVRRSIDSRRFNARLLAAFSACALLLSAIGLYGSLSFSLGQRRRDIAVRIALGAQHRNLWQLVLGEAATPVLAGVGLGLAASIAASHALEAMMFGVTPSDPVSYALVLLTFGAVVALVAIAGFRRAASADVRTLLSDV